MEEKREAERQTRTQTDKEERNRDSDRVINGEREGEKIREIYENESKIRNIRKRR